MLHIISVLFVVSRLVTVCHSDSLPIPNALSIVSIARSSNVGINEGVNSLVNRHKSCPEGYELGKDKKDGRLRCRCKKYHLYWPDDGICYREYEQGPCPEGHRLVLDETSRRPICTCPFFSAEYADGKCYQEFTQGPCPFGQLMILDRTTGRGKCGCDQSNRMYYHPPTEQCFELYHQGPCPEGHILSFNYGNLVPECKCKEGYYLHSDGKCYKLNTRGPCSTELSGCRGTPCFMKSLEALEVQCTCLPKHSTTEDGRCYEPYTRGPCPFGEWLVFKKSKDDSSTARCEGKKYCKRFDNWHWWAPHQRCYRQFSQGPCKKGKLFYLDTERSGTGCYCQPEWDVYYYKQTGKCYEQESKGPCPVGQYFAYNATSRSTECSCFKNFVYTQDKGTCIEQYTQGQCPPGQLVVGQSGNVAGCDCGPHMKDHFWPIDGKCYPHYERGPCEENEQFRKHPTKDHGATCIVWGKTSNSNGY